MIETTLALILFLFPLAYSPGPGNLIFAAGGARFGFWATMPASLGYHLFTWVVTCGIGLGFLTALERYPQAFAAVKIAGAAYVFWIALTMIRSGAHGGAEEGRPMSFWDGGVLLLLNPKAYVIIALMFTQFLTPPFVGTWAVVLIATVFTLNNWVAFSVWTLLGDRIAALLRSETRARTLNGVFGVVLAGVAVWMLVS